MFERITDEGKAIEYLFNLKPIHDVAFIISNISNHKIIIYHSTSNSFKRIDNLEMLYNEKINNLETPKEVFNMNEIFLLL